MKHLIILGDGMADHPIERLGGKTTLQYANTPGMDFIARNGRTGRLSTIPKGFQPGSEVANTAILGYDLNKVYEGRGPLEAASIGYDMEENDLALRCNIITLSNGAIKNHHGGHLTTEQGDALIRELNEALGNDKVSFHTGTQYRHLLIINGGNKHIVCAPPHDHPNEAWQDLLVKPEDGWENKKDNQRMTAGETANLLNELIIKSQEFLKKHTKGNSTQETLSIWPWGGGYRPAMKTLMEVYPQIKSGAVISAVDLIKGIGRYAGLQVINVDGATGLADTNYEGKAEAALAALKTSDFVFLHVEASDEAGHDGDLELKLRTIENFDKRIVTPICNELQVWEGEPVSVALLPDHPTPVEIRTHVDEPVPFAIWHKDITPDSVQTFDEVSCVSGCFGMLHLGEFMQEFMKE